MSLAGPGPADVATDADRPGQQSWLQAVLASAGVGSLAGAIAGAVWGGLGGRIAMRVVFLTSSEHVRGLTSDDGFEIGTISGATVFLVIFTTVLGAIAGLLYGIVRMVTAGPPPLVAMGVGVALAAGGGASIVHRDGVDFRFLEPLWLTVGLFVLLPGLWGATVVLLTERLLRPGALSPTPPARIGERRFGLIGWTLLIVITVVGTLDLVADIDHLR